MASTTSADCIATSEYEVHVFNRLPDPKLKLHCASKDDDLGYHEIVQNYDFNWKFCDSFTKRTLFFCHLWWLNKDAAFDVFKSKSSDDCDRYLCLWEARSDGIYFSSGSPPKLFRKKFAWNVSRSLMSSLSGYGGEGAGAVELMDCDGPTIMWWASESRPNTRPFFCSLAADIHSCCWFGDTEA
ncbi:S-protein11 [Sesamum angolense]|uniref:S-protein homolog n=1 Tax=Sesamum angolense TaxID=2727404 RepID=A0AAE1WZC6_9LAMI|nr:S-protein11 [Sesamum angolense]